MNKKPRHSGAGRNPGNGDAVLNGRQILSDAAFGLLCLWLSFPQSENGLLQLDSGLRRNDERGNSGFYQAAAGVLGDLFQTCLPAAGRQE